MAVVARRLGRGPIIHQGLCQSLRDNINGPSLVVRPDWAPGPGRYMLYFSHHMGRHIRLAFADDLTGPWRIHEPGVLPLRDTPFAQTPPDVPQPQWAVDLGVDGLYPHLASPDVRADHSAGEFVMWVHGLAGDGEQVSYRARSGDGLSWDMDAGPIPYTYLRLFDRAGQRLAVGHGGQVLHMAGDAVEPGPFLLGPAVRHCGVLVRGDLVHLFFTRIGDAPERILHQAVRPADRLCDWKAVGAPVEILRPQDGWEGARLPVRPSRVGAVGFACELRDPFVFEDAGRIYMIYAGGGETALGLAQLTGL